MSLRAQLIASIALVALVALVFGAGLSYWHALNKVEEEMQAAIAVGARIAANAIDDSEEAADPSRRLHHLVADFNGDRHIQAVWRDSGGRVIARSQPSREGASVPEWFEALIEKPEMTARVSLPPAFNGLGSLVLTTDSRNEIGEVWDDLWKTLAILGLLCGLFVSAVYAILGRALRPLDDLAAAFTRVCVSGTPPKMLQEHGPSEFREVYRGFNAMAERLQTTEAKNRRLTDQIAVVQEEERADLARDLHDEIGPFLFSVDVDAASILRLQEEGRADEIPARVATIRDSIGHMQRHVKELLGRLRAAALVDVGLLDAIDNIVSFWRQRCPGVSFHIEAPDTSFGPEFDQTVFRIVQESVSNAMRHANPENVSIAVRDTGNGVTITVLDDGRGLEDDSMGSGAGFGIAGMRERVASLGGTFEVRNRADHSGTRIRAYLPFDGRGRQIEQMNERDEPVVRSKAYEQA